MKTISLILPILALTAVDAIAQAPGAHWSITANVGASMSQRRENPGCASSTHMYVFGGKSGNAGGSAMNDLWEFDGATWTEKTKNGAAGSPPARDKAGVAWDFTGNKLIVFGGQGASGALLNDMWSWDRQTNTWTDLTPASGNPSARRFTSIAHDPQTTGMVMFGGLDAVGHQNDTWVFLNGAWTKIPSTGAQTPSTRRQHHLVRRPDFMDVILIAGQDVTLPKPTRFRTDVWKLSGLAWTQIPTTTAPAATVANDATYDEARQRIILVGGNGINGGSPTAEISEFDSISNEWVTKGTAPVGDPVIGRVSRFFMAYVPSLGKTYKISGQGGPAGSGPTVTLDYQSTTVAEFTTRSPGCAGSAGTPDLSSTGTPWLGRSLDLIINNLPAASAPVMTFGFGTQTLDLGALGLGAPGCIATTTLNATAPIALNGTTGSMSIPVPNDPNLVGASLHFQAVVLDLAIGGKFTVSNRREAIFGAL